MRSRAKALMVQPAWNSAIAVDEDRRELPSPRSRRLGPSRRGLGGPWSDDSHGMMDELEGCMPPREVPRASWRTCGPIGGVRPTHSDSPSTCIPNYASSQRGSRELPDMRTLPDPFRGRISLDISIHVKLTHPVTITTAARDRMVDYHEPTSAKLALGSRESR